MNSYFDAWKSVAGALLPQALAGAPAFEAAGSEPLPASATGFTATLSGDFTGGFSVVLDPAILDTALVGEGIDQRAGWLELLREVAESAAGELLAKTGRDCRIASFEEAPITGVSAQVFTIGAETSLWRIWVIDAIREPAVPPAEPASPPSSAAAPPDSNSPAECRPGIDLLLDIELEATVRFGCRELPLGDILELGPGDVVELDRRVTDPVDLIVGDKIVAQGEVVLIDGSFGLRVTSVAEPQKRLESIRCLF